MNIEILAAHKMKNLEANNKRPAPTSWVVAPHVHMGLPPPPPHASGAQPPHPMWVMHRPPPLQGQALANAYWSNPSVVAKGSCYNCGGMSLDIYS